MSQVDSIDFIYENETEIIEIEPFEDEEEEEAPPPKIKRLMCNINGCTYQTDRRRDLRRHKRSMKHWDNDIRSSDSESDIDRAPFLCKPCNYTTAKKFCFDRHVRSVRHMKRKQAAGEEEEQVQEMAGPPPEIEKPPDPVVYTWETVQDEENILLTCVPCGYSTTQRIHMDQHNGTLLHQQVMQNIADDSEFIEFAPQAEEEEVQDVKETVLEDEHVPISLEIDRECDSYLSVDGGTFECTACEYKTARKFCFVRHVQSRKHLAKLQELEEQEAIVQANLGDIIEYAPTEERIFEEVMYLPTDDDPGESAYYIIMNNND